ncbi:hypothetical protein [Thermanaerovibrio acidaminovorans]
MAPPAAHRRRGPRQVKGDFHRGVKRKAGGPVKPYRVERRRTPPCG